MIYAEMTPNPSTMKFVADKLLIENGGVAEFTDVSQTAGAPLAARLFTFPFVKGVFFAANFVTITKNNLVEWDDVVLEVREYLTNYLNAGNDVFSKRPAQVEVQGNNTQAAGEEIHPSTPTEERIVDILEEYVRPAVEGDGGAIHFKSYQDGVLTLTLKGSCSGCPSSTITLKSGIQSLFDRMLPEVKEVVAQEE